MVITKEEKLYFISNTEVSGGVNHAFIEKLHKGKDTHNQKILGGVWTFFFVAYLCFIIMLGH